MREGPIKVRTHTTNLTSNSRVSDKAVKAGVHKQGQPNQTLALIVVIFTQYLIDIVHSLLLKYVYD